MSEKVYAVNGETDLFTGLGYKIKCGSTGAVLDDRGGAIGPNNTIKTYVGMQNDNADQWEPYRVWKLIKVQNGYRIKGNAGAVLDDCGGATSPDNRVITQAGLQADIYDQWDARRTWTLVKVDGGYRIKCATGAVLDDNGGRVGPGNNIILHAGLQNDVYNEYNKHRTWTFIPHGSGHGESKLSEEKKRAPPQPSWTTENVISWLSQFSYASPLLAAVSELKMTGKDVLENVDDVALKDCGIENKLYRSQVLRKIHPPLFPSESSGMERWSTDEVVRWLGQFSYAAPFVGFAKQAQISGFDLKNVDDLTLQDCGIARVLARRQLLSKIKDGR